MLALTSTRLPSVVQLAQPRHGGAARGRAPRESLVVRIAHDEAAVPVDRDDRRQAQLDQGPGHAEDGRYLECPRQDGDVARSAARLGDDRLYALAVHRDHVGGQEIARHEDDVLAEAGEAGPLALEQMPEDAPRYVLYVGDPIAKRGIVGLTELVGEFALYVHDDPLDVDQALAQGALDPFVEVGVVEHE
jgi:hypothetical protein